MAALQSVLHAAVPSLTRKPKPMKHTTHPLIPTQEPDFDIAAALEQSKPAATNTGMARPSPAQPINNSTSM